jgi:putative chitinase
MRLSELYDQDVYEADLTRRGFLRGLGAAGAAGLAGYAALNPGDKPQAPAPQASTPPEEVNKFTPTEPAPAAADTTKQKDAAASQYGSTSKHVNAENQNKLAKYARANGITGVELAALLAQCAHETMGFHRMAEVGTKDYFAKYDGKLGNNRPGDGYRYRGRTFLHITGKENYDRVGKALRIDLVKHPELLERPEVGLKATLWYWNNKVKPYIKDFNDVIAVTQRVNGSAEGLGDRSSNFEDYKRKLGIS